MKHKYQQQPLKLGKALLGRVAEPEDNHYDELYAHARKRIEELGPGIEVVAAELIEGGPVPREGRVLGAIMRRLRSENRIIRTSRVSTSYRSHGGLARVWRVP